VQRLAGDDLIRVNAAKDQQMVIWRQMMEGLDGRPEPLVFVQKAENTDQHSVGGQRVEYR
jgi:hypothetical protein